VRSAWVRRPSLDQARAMRQWRIALTRRNCNSASVSSPRHANSPFQSLVGLVHPESAAKSHTRLRALGLTPEAEEYCATPLRHATRYSRPVFDLSFSEAQGVAEPLSPPAPATSPLLSPPTPPALSPPAPASALAPPAPASEDAPPAESGAPAAPAVPTMPAAPAEPTTPAAPASPPVEGLESEESLQP